MYETAKILGYVFAPLTLALALWLAAAVCLAGRRCRAAGALALIALLGLWVAALPALGDRLARALESQYPAVVAQAAPAADAIVLLGGALGGAYPPLRPTFNMGPAADRVWHAAALYRAGKAPWVVVAAGNQPGQAHLQVEAQAVTEMLTTLGVPRSAIVLESASRNTMENARNTRALLEQRQWRRLLLVTSAQHMPRAVKTFRKLWAGSGLVLLPASTDVEVADTHTQWQDWLLPSAAALAGNTKLLKEYAGLLLIDMM